MATEPGEVDEPIEEQTDAAIAAASVIIADAILSQGDQSEEDADFWLPILTGTLRLVLVQFGLTAVKTLFPAAPVALIRRAAETAATDATRRAAEIIAAGVPDEAPDVTPRRPTDDPEAFSPTDKAAEARTTAGRAARASVVGTRETARSEAAEELGAVYKVWRTRRDNRVRPTHGGLEGNRIPLSSEFITFEGNHLRFPRDPLAPLEETAECRCRLSYVMKDKP